MSIKSDGIRAGILSVLTMGAHKVDALLPRDVSSDVAWWQTDWYTAPERRQAVREANLFLMEKARENQNLYYDYVGKGQWIGFGIGLAIIACFFVLAMVS